MVKFYKSVRRFLSTTLIGAMMISILGTSVLIPLPAHAAITAAGPYDLLPSEGMMLPASSFDAPILRFSLNQSAGETLSSVAITIVNNTGGGKTNDTLAGHIKYLRVWRDANSNNFFDPENDQMAGQISVINVATSTSLITTASNNSIANSSSLATSFFVTINTDSDWATGDNILVNMAANGITTSANSPTVTALTGSKPIMFGQGGGGGMGFFVSSVTYVDTKTVDVMFSDTLDMMSGNTTSTANYSITTANGGDNSTTTLVTVLPDNRSVRLTANGAVIVSTGTDTVAVSNLVKNSQGSPNTAVSPMPIMSGMQPIVISEIKVGSVTDEYDEFIELYNRSNGSFDVSNIKLHLINASGTADKVATLNFVSGATTMSANKYLLIAPVSSPASSSADAVYSTSTVLTSLIPNGAAYVSFSTASSTAVIDRACWGAHSAPSDCEGGAITSGGGNDGTSMERKAFNNSTAVTMSAGGADVSMGNSIDTQNNSFDFIIRTSPDPQNRNNSAEVPSGGSFGGAGNGAPSIMHGPLFSASRDSTLNLIARIFDDGGPVPSSNAKMIFCVTNTSCAPASSSPIYGVSIGSGWYKFSSTSSNWASGKSYLKYYLQASDSATPPKTSVFTNNPNYDTVTFNHETDGIPSAALQESNALTISLSSGNLGGASLSGTVNNSSGAAVSGATVWLDGTQFAATTGNDGAFSFSNVGPSGGRQIKVAKDGYMDQSINTYIPATGLVNLGTITLYSGTMGQGGDYNMPSVVGSFPQPGMSGFPTQSPSGGVQPIELNFSKGMDSATITDADASDASSNVYLTEAGSQTKIAGAVTLTGNTQMRFTPAVALTVGKAYTLIVTPAVKDTVGNPIGGNGPGGAYVLGFSTAGQMFTDPSQIGGNFGMGNAFPPFVVGSQPSPGKMGVSLNTKIAVTFSEAMQNSPSNLANVKLYKVTNQFTASESKTLVATINALNSDNKIVILTPSAVLDASSHYRAEVTGGIMSSKGIPLGNPGQAGYATTAMFKSDFDTGSSSDSTAPGVQGTIPASGATGVSTIKPVLINFNEPMNPATITDSTVSLKMGSTAIVGNLSYDANSWTATFAPTYALTPTSTYTITVTTDVTDLAGNALDTDTGVAGNQGLLRTFNTGSADVTPLIVNSLQGSEFGVKVSFSKPMLSVTNSDTNFGSSVLNSANYSLRVVNSSGAVQSTVVLTAANFSYESATRSVAITGLPAITGFTPGSTLFNVVVSNVRDIGYSVLSAGSDSATTTAQSSQTMGNFSSGGGMIPMTDSSGNMIQGGMYGPPPTAIKTFTDSGIGFIPGVKVYPFNSMSGVSTIYGVEMPISKQIPADGFIDITFPDGTDVSGAKKDPNSPPNADLNGPGPGTVVFASSDGTLPAGWSAGGASNDGVLVSATAPVVRVILGSVATRCGAGNATPCSDDSHDFLRFDIAQIINSTITKGVNTTGNTATVETKKSDGTAIEALSSGSFFTSAAGEFTVRGRLLVDSTGLNGVNVFLMSPMTGPQTTSTANGRFGGQDGEFMFQNLVPGTYMLGTEQYFKVGATSYTSSFPSSVNVNSTNCSSNNCTQNISVSDASSGATVTLSVSGVFSNDRVDIFAGGPGSFRMATTTLNGTLTNNTSNSIKLNANGVWMVGFGPAMSTEIFGKGGPATPPSWMIPKPQQVMVSGCPSACTASPSTVSFNVSAANKTVKFTVKDASGNAIGQANIFAYSPGTSMGGGTNANADGTGSLSLSYGAYKMGASVAGMPGGIERSVSIKNDGGTDKVFIDGTSTGIALSSMTVADLVLTISKPSYTISGKVTDGTNAISGAPVSGYRTDGPGNSNTFTNSSGEYTLYVNNGTWKVQAFTPQYGKLPEKTITVAGSDQSGQNFEPNTASINYGTVTKSVFVDSDGNSSYSAASDEELANVQMIVEGTTSGGEHYVNTTLTDTNGSSTFKLPPGTYSMKAWSPTIGQLPAFDQDITVNSSGTVTQEPSNLLAPKTGNVTINILDQLGNATTTSKAVFEFSQIGGKTDKVDVFSNVASSTISLPVYDAGATSTVINNSTSTSPANFYLMKVTIPGMSGAMLNASGNALTTVMATSTATEALWKVEIDGNETINIKLPDINYMSGTVKDAENNAVADAIVRFENATTGETTEVQANSSGVYSAKLSAGTYKMQADKDGYIDTAQTVAVSASGTIASAYTTMDVAAYTISGTVYINGTAAVGATVRAEKLGGGVVTATTGNDGTYTLRVIAGDWKVSASADGYSEKQYGSVVSVSGNVSGINISLTSTKSGLAGSTSLSMTPQTGGALSDTSANMNISAPASAISSSANSYSMSEKETSNVVGGGSGSPIAGEAKEITTYDNDGNSVSTLNKDISVNVSYTKEELTTAMSGATLAEIEDVKMGSWDTTSDNWQHLPTTICYKDSSGNFVEPQSDLSNVSTVSFTGQTLHLSVFNPITGSDGLAPAAPSSVTATGGASSVTITWTAPTTNADSSSLTDLLGYEIYRSTSQGGSYAQLNTSDITGTSYTDTTAVSGTTYYYKVTAADTGGLESVFSSASNGVSLATGESVNRSGGGGAPTPTVTAPSNMSLAVHAGAVETTASVVSLSISAVSASQMMVSNLASFVGATWETYATSKNWVLSSGLGKKTVYIKFKSPSGVESEAVSDSIVLLPAKAVQNITASAGGKIGLTDNLVSVDVPAGAIAKNASFSISPGSVYVAPPAKNRVVGERAYDLAAESDGLTVKSFSKEITLTFKYTVAELAGIAEETLGIYYWDDAKSQWVKLSGTINKTAKTVTAKTNHFTLFVLMGEGISRSGELVKMKCDSSNKTICTAVYYVGNDGKRYVFPNEKTYFTWYADFKSVKEITASELASYTIGGNVTYKPGVKMIKITTDPKVYVVGKNGLLREIASEVVAKALYGDTWNKQIDDVPDAFFVNYTLGAKIAAAEDYVVAEAKTASPTINADKVL